MGYSHHPYTRKTILNTVKYGMYMRITMKEVSNYVDIQVILGIAGIPWTSLVKQTGSMENAKQYLVMKIAGFYPSTK